MKLRSWAVACLVAAAVTAPAAADQVTDLRASLQAASAKLHSFRMTMASPLGVSIAMTVLIKPLRLHMMFTGPLTLDTYVQDNYIYQHAGTAPWKKQLLPTPMDQLNFAKTLAGAVHMTIGADVVDGGVTYGEVDIAADPSMFPGATQIPPMTLHCTYDKTTFLMHACATALFDQQFSGYDDPANIVMLPPEAAAAPDAGPLTLPSPAAGATP